MKLRMFSVVGGALNFGLRRMETIMRVAWLPVVLILIFNMASVFAALSVANDRLVTFADLAHGVPYGRAVEASQKVLYDGMLAGSAPMWTIFGTTTLLSVVLLASFMAPLVRYAGLGELPSPGVVKLAFGPDQIRYIIATLLGLFVTVIFVYAPVSIAAFLVLQYIIDALSQTFVAFPNPDSLHTIKLVSAHDVLAARGELWYHLQGVPMAVAAGFAVIFWLVLIAHFAPKNRGRADAGNLAARAAVTAIAMGGLVAIIWAAIDDKNNQAVTSLGALIAVAALIAIYFSLRVFSFAGIAVCRRSLAPAGLLRVTRGWNLFRLLFVVILMGTTIIVVQYVVNVMLVGIPVFPLNQISIGGVVNFLYAATATATKLVNSGEVAPWVLPLFRWVWNAVVILVNFLLLFFFYGALAGLQGRLYRESERGEA